MDAQAELYRHFDSTGQLIYVGVSVSAVARLSQHRVHARWFRDIARVDVQHFADRQAALDAEKKAIREENPVCNKQGKRSEHEIAEARQRQEEISRAEREKRLLTHRVVNLDPVYTLEEAARLLKTSAPSLKREILAGRLRCLETIRQSRPHKRNPSGKVYHRKITGWHLIDYMEENGYF